MPTMYNVSFGVEVEASYHVKELYTNFFFVEGFFKSSINVELYQILFQPL